MAIEFVFENVLAAAEHAGATEMLALPALPVILESAAVRVGDGVVTSTAVNVALPPLSAAELGMVAALSELLSVTTPL